MRLRNRNTGGVRGVFAALHGFLAERRGVAALEFALIVPLMLALYLLALEFSQAIGVDKKISRIASQVGDLVTQQPLMTRDELKGIMKISDAILRPYRRSEPEITVTAIRITDETRPKAEVVWSRRYANGAYAPAESPGTTTVVPQSLMVPGTFLVRSEVELEYWPVLAWSAEEVGFGGISGGMFPIVMGERYYLSPRMTRTIPCNDC